MVAEGITRKFWVEGVLYAKSHRPFVPLTWGLQKELLKETHDSPWAGHPGQECTLALLSQSYYWPRMENDVEQYVKTCLVCQQDKTERRKEAGLLEQLPILERPWMSLSMDYIVNLPKVDNCRSIIVVVDRFSKYATFISAPHVVSAETTAKLFFKNIIKLWGIPLDIVSDKDARFTRRFWVARCSS